MLGKSPPPPPPPPPPHHHHITTTTTSPPHHHHHHRTKLLCEQADSQGDGSAPGGACPPLLPVPHGGRRRAKARRHGSRPTRGRQRLRAVRLRHGRRRGGSDATAEERRGGSQARRRLRHGRRRMMLVASRSRSWSRHTLLAVAAASECDSREEGRNGGRQERRGEEECMSRRTSKPTPGAKASPLPAPNGAHDEAPREQYHPRVYLRGASDTADVATSRVELKPNDERKRHTHTPARHLFTKLPPRFLGGANAEHIRRAGRQALGPRWLFKKARKGGAIASPIFKSARARAHNPVCDTCACTSRHAQPACAI